MAGKRHHFIPQFLQRGFASHMVAHTTKPADYNAWVFRKNGEPFNTNIKNIALEGQFYNHNGDTSVDDNITDAEGPLAAFATQIRCLRNGSVVDPINSASLLTHLSMRTRHLRQNLKEIGETFMARIVDALSNSEILERALIDWIRKNPEAITEIFEEQLNEVFNQASIPEQYRGGLSQVLLPTMHEAFARMDLRDNVRTTAGAISVFGESLRSDATRMDTTAKNSHLQALQRSLTPAQKIQALSNLKYRVVKYQKGDIVLGDSTTVFAIDASRKVTPFFDGVDTVNAALLPLDPQTCLVGEAVGFQGLFDESHEVRQQAAACSRELFLAHATTEDNFSLRKKIGTNSHLLADSEIDGVMKELGLHNDE